VIGPRRGAKAHRVDVGPSHMIIFEAPVAAHVLARTAASLSPEDVGDEARALGSGLCCRGGHRSWQRLFRGAGPRGSRGRVLGIRFLHLLRRRLSASERANAAAPGLSASTGATASTAAWAL
jgi:hypothetical protein